MSVRTAHTASGKAARVEAVCLRDPQMGTFNLIASSRVATDMRCFSAVKMEARLAV